MKSFGPSVGFVCIGMTVKHEKTPDIKVRCCLPFACLFLICGISVVFKHAVEKLVLNLFLGHGKTSEPRAEPLSRAV